MKSLAPWLRLLVSGADNASPAIGRVLALIFAAVLGLGVPVAILGHLFSHGADASVLFSFLTSVGPYEVLLVGVLTALIFGTNPTEPKPPAS
jgi:cytochrome c biogenesis protein CcdA